MEPPFTDAEIAAFQAKLKIDPTTGCHEWTGARQKPGKRKQHPYGITSYRKKQMNAHRLAKMMEIGGPIPDGKWVLHRCDNPPCCNPTHLYLGSPKDNVHDMVARGRRSQGLGRGCSISDELVNEMAASGLGVHHLTEVYGRSPDTIKGAFARLGLKIPRPRFITDRCIHDLAASGLETLEKMSQACGFTSPTIRDGLLRLGYPLPPGSVVPHNKIPEARIREIAAAGLKTFTDMEKVFGHDRRTLAIAFDRYGVPRPTRRHGGRPNKTPTNPTKGA